MLLASLLTVVLAFALPLPVSAQEAERPAGSVSRAIEVRVTNIDVVVTDARGAHMPGLGREDFEIFEDGVRRTVSNFSAIGAAERVPTGGATPPAATIEPPEPTPPAATPRPTWLVLFVDNRHLTPAHRNRALEQVRDLVSRAAASRAQVLVITADRTPKIRQKFTSDPALLSHVIQELEGEGAGGLMAETARRSAFEGIDSALQDLKLPSAIGLAQAYAANRAADLDVSLRALRTTLDQLSALEGRKVLIHVSDGLPQWPGEDAFDYIRSSPSFSSASKQSRLPLAPAFDRSQRFRELTQAANAARVALYMVDATGLSGDEFGVGADMPLRPAGKVEPFRERMNLQAMLSYAAEQTGGTAILNRTDITEPLRQVEEDLGAFYSLGYESLRRDEDATHRVEVRVRRPGLTVRAQRSLRVKSADTRVAEGVTSALFFGRPENPFGATVAVGEPESRGKLVVLPLRIRVPEGKITLLPDGPRRRGRVVFYYMVRDEEGDVSDLVRQEVVVSDPGELLHDTLLKIKRGRQVISLAVRDALAGTASYVQKTMLIPGAQK